MNFDESLITKDPYMQKSEPILEMDFSEVGLEEDKGTNHGLLEARLTAVKSIHKINLDFLIFQERSLNRSVLLYPVTYSIYLF